MSLTKVSYSMISGNIFDVDDFGADPTGATDSSAAFRSAVVAAAAANGGVIQFNGIYKLDTPVTGITSNMTITGLGCSKIINGISSARGTDDALFSGAGTLTSSGTITANFDAGSYTVTVSTPGNFAVGDVVTFTGDYIGRNISIVVDVTGATLTLDRDASNDAASGSTIYKVTPIRNTVVGDFYVDFNGTTAAPRYGYGVSLTDAQDCRIQNINAQNIGSKVAQFARSFDCTITNVSCNIGTDNGGTGGHGYVVRLSVCNDCFVEKCFGHTVRHTVDMTGASRNVIANCKGTGNQSATFLTHSNGCKDNLWQDNTSIGSGTCAYQFDESLGDTGNTVDGGFIQNDLIFRSPSVFSYENTTSVRNLTVLNNGTRIAIPTTGQLTFENCTFISSYPLIAAQNAAAILTFKNCSFTLLGLRSLASLSTNTQVIRIIFNGCEIDCTGYQGVVFEGGDGTTLDIVNCEVIADETTSTNGIFESVTKEINALNSTFRFFGTGGIYFFGANTDTALTLDGCRFINSSDIARRYTVGVSMIIGQNQYINSALPSFANWSNLQTIGAVDIGTNAAPSTGAWLAGAKILFSTPPAGGNIGAVCTTSGTPGTWKTYGAIAA